MADATLDMLDDLFLFFYFGICAKAGVIHTFLRPVRSSSHPTSTRTHTGQASRFFLPVQIMIVPTTPRFIDLSSFAAWV